VLGVEFNTNRLEWRLHPRKIADIVAAIELMQQSGHSDLKQMEKLTGKLNNFAQMMPFAKLFKRTMNQFLAGFAENYEILLEVPEHFKKDLDIWKSILTCSPDWLPIAKEMDNPVPDALRFVSDAAGGTGNEVWAGVASIGELHEKSFWYLGRGVWPPSVYSYRDEKGAALAQKMTTLELVGLFLPFLTVPEVVRGRNIVLGVDNLGVVFAWENGYAKGDLLASSLVRALGIVAAYLECRVHVQHVPRLTTLSSVMADNLTRASTATAEVWSALVGVRTAEPPAGLWDWLSDPVLDWELGLKLVDEIKEIIEF
jgi:hypothetical protein